MLTKPNPKGKKWKSYKKVLMLGFVDSIKVLFITHLSLYNDKTQGVFTALLKIHQTEEISCKGGVMYLLNSSVFEILAFWLLTILSTRVRCSPLRRPRWCLLGMQLYPHHKPRVPQHLPNLIAQSQ